ncbi:branched-chain alpha-keto acid dehydrogenase subunit E2 [Streptomyces cyaneogriseus subsp. noncyanogenus]|uniref:Dihydrolipoamide acetyltransferase component of pyruvate dehydrogenase complex n=1 Tax=Streptomyces cyaneogriseus subsp. noncyanogenus TaxID=477245 RepID=A0A0C5G0I7_9ACTN|nr:dihydrolipoamide acetyltransferase family protein [Streptomyces cyaneogriseus]AJP02040.1 branched-chain alpha-keto acid dehydrogenase subunit E2 [Streptomyces cyaneogriseus subsp. noncyanogenus]
MTDTLQRYREFRMPDVGEGLRDAEIIRWLVAPGDTVDDGQPVCEVETAKASVELPVPFAGVVRDLCFPEGATVAVGTPIITVDTLPRAADAEAPAQARPPADAGDPQGRTPVLVGYGAAPAAPARRARRRAGTPAPAAPVTAAPAAPALPLAKPPVRKLAKELGVDLAAVVPTGPRGDITRADVEALAPGGERPDLSPAPPAPSAEAADETRIPVTGVRRATARAMVASAFTAPHVTEFVTVDVTRTMKLIDRLKRHPDMAGRRVGPLLLAARAFTLAVRRHPEINASWDEERQEIVRKRRINLGIAAATPRGLLVPVVEDAGHRTLPDLATALDELVTTAREGRTPPAALRGGTVTLTNIGVFGVDTGTPILNPGESAILALGTIAPRPWVHRGRVVPRQVTTLALSFDHRLVDGDLGSRVLADTAALLHDPDLLITRA